MQLKIFPIVLAEASDPDENGMLDYITSLQQFIRISDPNWDAARYHPFHHRGEAICNSCANTGEPMSFPV